MTGVNKSPLLGELIAAASAEADIDSLGGAAKTLANSPLQVADLLSSFLTAPGTWARIAAGAYCHPNGFTKFVLSAQPDLPFRLRLHVWNPGRELRRQQDEQNVHGHRWDFASAVVAGSGLEVDEYVPCDTGGTIYRSYEYRPADAAAFSAGAEYAASDADLVPAGEARLDHSVRYTLAAGDSYSCGTDRLHTVRSRTADITATLVVQGPSVLAHAPVFRRPDQPAQAAAQPLSDARAREVMAATIDAIRQHAGGR
jgi:hypothetical protein